MSPSRHRNDVARSRAAAAAAALGIGLLALALLGSPAERARAQGLPAASRAGELLAATPADAWSVLVVDVARLPAVFPGPSGVLLGEDSPLLRGLNATLFAHTGLSITPEAAGLIIGPTEDSWALLLLGDVSGTVALEARTYRGFDLYRDASSALTLAVVEGGLVVGELAPVTGVLDVLSGATTPFGAGPAANAVAGLSTDAGLTLAIGPRGLTEVAADAGLSPLAGAALALEAEQTTLRLTFASAEAARAGQAVVGLALASLRAELGERLGSAEAADSWLEEIGVRFAGALSSEMLDAVTVALDGSTLELRYAGPAAMSVVAGGAVTFLSAFRRYADRSRTTEATMNVRRLFDSAISYYDTDHVGPDGSLLPPQFPSSIAMTPTPVPCGEAAAPRAEHWDQPTWVALNFAVADPHFYSYQFDAAGTGVGAEFIASAFGDVDCDGVYSTFIRVGHVEDDGEILGGAGMYQDNELE